MPRAALALLLGLLAALPLLLRGASCGHDFDFHLQSWLAVRAAWHAGLLAPHWVPGANYGAGEPRLVFYPLLSWLLGAALGTVLPWAYVPAAFTGVCFAGAAWSMHRLASRFCAPVQSLLAAVLYALSPYLLFTGYERTACGEMLAAVFFPPLLGALLRPQPSVTWIAGLLAALWYTNAPAAVMGCYLVLLWLAWRMIAALRGSLTTGVENRNPFVGAARDALRAVGALAFAGALAADYLLPAWYEQRFVAIRRAVGPGMRVEDSFLFGHTGEPFHDQVLHTASSIALATLGAGTLAALWLLLRSRVRAGVAPIEGAVNTKAPGLLTAMLLACFLLQLPFSRPLWHILPEFGFLQFPWRLLLPSSAAAALLLAMALPTLKKRGRIGLLLLTAAYTGGILLWAAQTRYQPCDDEDNVAAQQMLRTGAGFEGTDEYAAVGSDNGEIQQGLPPVRLLAQPDADECDDSGQNGDAANPAWNPHAAAMVPGRVNVVRWQAESLTVRLTPAADAYAVLRLERFPAWRVLLNGAPCDSACVPRDDGLLTIHLPAARETEIDAQYTATEDVWTGRAVSLCALAGMLLVASRRRRHRTARL